MHECRTCSKQFQSVEALLSHTRAAHGTVPGIAPSASSKKKYLAGIIIVGVLVILAYGASTLISPASAENVALAKCIAASGAKFYGAFWCPHCQDQKDLFGSAAKHLPYVECSNSDRSQKQVCADAGIEGYPTWVFADCTRANVLTKPQLAGRTNCPYTEA